VADLDPLRAGEAWGTSAAWYAAVLLRRATPGDADEAARVIGQAAARSLAADCGTVPATHGSRCGLTTALTSRESEVLSHIAAGQTNSQIAADLSISIHTVTRHVTHIFEKLAVPNRAAAAVHGREFGRSGAAVNPA
jgi:LuxR family maltose regulon positive regulatory protein